MTGQYNRANWTADYTLSGFKIENLTGLDVNFTNGNFSGVVRIGDNILINGSGKSWFNSGNVGIGTVIPDSKLHIKEDIPGTVGSHPAGQCVIRTPICTIVVRS